MSLTENQRNFDTFVSTINTHWDQLNEDLNLLLVGLDSNCSVDSVTCAPIPEDSHALTFVERLLNCVGEAREGESEGNDLTLYQMAVPTAEPKFAARIAWTKQVMARVAHCLRLRDAAQRSILARLHDGTDAPIREQLDALQAEAQRATREAGMLHARHSSATARLRMAEDRCLSLKLRVDELTQETEHTKTDLEWAQRRVDKMKQQMAEEREKLKRERASLEQCRQEATSHVSAVVADQEGPQAALALELENSRALAEQRLQEANAMREERLKLERELHQLKAQAPRVDDLTRNQTTQRLRDQLDQQTALNEQHKATIARLQSELQAIVNARKSAIDIAEAAAARQNEQLLARVREVESEGVELRHQLDQAQRKLEAAKQLVQRTQTPIITTERVNEYKATIAQLQKDTERLRAERTRLREANERLTQQTVAGKQAHLQLESDRAALQQAHDALAQSDAEHKAAGEAHCAKEREWQEKEREMRVLLDVCKSGARDPRDVLELKASERLLTAEVARLRKDVTEASSAAQREAVEHRARAEELEALSKAHALRIGALERELAACKEASNSDTSEKDTLLEELDMISKEFEELQDANVRLLQQLSEKDDAHMQLMTDRMKDNSRFGLLLREKSLLSEKVAAAERLHAARSQLLAKTEERSVQFRHMLESANEELRTQNQMVEAYKRSSVESANRAQEMESRVTILEKQLHEYKQTVDNAITERDRETARSSRLEEESSQLQRKLDKMSSLGPFDSDAAEKLQMYKALYTCSVCHDRLKSVVLTKCFHCFCRECIQRNIEIRHRKCPACGKPFGVDDVHNIYL
eukprot:gnl/Trimastix_PCT/2404.p1 GENE.gnl/Trimastix_PCT/2404~~gnl/Trimastix_PCT/2404.p1  ORF type:complete len:820 (+),score=300.17 gnl/Trimastix_PCT/2404:200-2659(+)